MAIEAASSANAWPALPLEAWSDTCATLHRWTQVVGKLKLALCPFVNHYWHVTHIPCRDVRTSGQPRRMGPVAPGAVERDLRHS